MHSFSKNSDQNGGPWIPVPLFKILDQFGGQWILFEKLGPKWRSMDPYLKIRTKMVVHGYLFQNSGQFGGQWIPAFLFKIKDQFGSQ